MISGKRTYSDLSATHLMYQTEAVQCVPFPVLLKPVDSVRPASSVKIFLRKSLINYVLMS